MKSETKSAHTLDRIHIPTSPCSCYVEFNGSVHRIKYCPSHDAAPELLDALIHKIEQCPHCHGSTLDCKSCEEAKVVIAKAEVTSK